MESLFFTALNAVLAVKHRGVDEDKISREAWQQISVHAKRQDDLDKAWGGWHRGRLDSIAFRASSICSLLHHHLHLPWPEDPAHER
ncbi:hypothetical protein JMJ77_0007884 [Colletotrichum scovillei]|uniref:Uncharacterized protein n=1 Tax=Colletotrichum scovillei TaxID=1209932 RepID=A0A9P7RDD7_9PEZI|nr:hypothetical protein JMJ77_0007884 [Colletotrichum scovillei]KAG7074814.1 hypothetical protein JMJ76_0011283 [Colletotrichum scovillei]KAG7081906.1 hypothetical protein JMJ78_0004018 [Colletotrichum scovillei]